MKNDRLNGALSVLEDVCIEENIPPKLLDKIGLLKYEFKVAGYDVDFDNKKYVTIKQLAYDEIMGEIRNLYGCETIPIDKSNDINQIISISKQSRSYRLWLINVSSVKSKLKKKFGAKYDVCSKNKILSIRLKII
jgi:hypothetical protein